MLLYGVNRYASDLDRPLRSIYEFVRRLATSEGARRDDAIAWLSILSRSRFMTVVSAAVLREQKTLLFQNAYRNSTVDAHARAECAG